MRPRLLLAGLLGACGGRAPGTPAPAPPLRFELLGNASASDSGPPTLRVDSQIVTIRGVDVLTEGAGLYGDVDLSEPHTLRLTLYDSTAGRPITDPLPPAPRSARRQVLYVARIGPVPAGRYEVWVGRYDARRRLVEVSHQPLRIAVPPAPKRRDERPRLLRERRPSPTLWMPRVSCAAHLEELQCRSPGKTYAPPSSAPVTNTGVRSSLTTRKPIQPAAPLPAT